VPLRPAVIWREEEVVSSTAPLIPRELGDKSPKTNSNIHIAGAGLFLACPAHAALDATRVDHEQPGRRSPSWIGLAPRPWEFVRVDQVKELPPSLLHLTVLPRASEWVNQPDKRCSEKETGKIKRAGWDQKTKQRLDMNHAMMNKNGNTLLEQWRGDEMSNPYVPYKTMIVG